MDKQLFHRHPSADELLLEEVLHQGLDVFAVGFAEKPPCAPVSQSNG